MKPSSDPQPTVARQALAAATAFFVTATGVFAASAPAMVIERWAGSLVFGVLTMIVVALLLRGYRPFKNRIAHAVGLIAAALLLVPVAIFAQMFEAGFDDGPFHGRPHSGDISALTASHSITYRSGDLVIYNRADDEPPVLAYIVQGVPKWALELDVVGTPGFEDSHFRSIAEPIAVSSGVFRDRLSFIAYWSFGAERGYAYIWKFGGVHRFYLSW